MVPREYISFPENIYRSLRIYIVLREYISFPENIYRSPRIYIVLREYLSFSENIYRSLNLTFLIYRTTTTKSLLNRHRFVILEVYRYSNYMFTEDCLECDMGTNGTKM